MTLEEILKEYENGCGVGNEKPSDCPDCLKAAVSAIHYWHDREGGWKKDATAWLN